MEEMKENKNNKDKMEELNDADKTTLEVCITLGDEFLAECNDETPDHEFQQKMIEIKDFYTALEEKMNDVEGYPEVREVKEIEAFPEPKAA